MTAPLAPRRQCPHTGRIDPKAGAAVWADFRYQLTCVGGFAPVYVADRVKDNWFRVAGGTPGLEVPWEVTACRSDRYMQAHPFESEQDKPKETVGTYDHPELYGFTTGEGEGGNGSRP